MKIRKIASICRESGRASIIDHVDGDGVVHQWITDGHAAYPVTGMPYLEAEHLPQVFELTKKQAEEMNIEAIPCPLSINFSDAIANETQCEDEPIGIVFCGHHLMPLSASGETWLIDRDYLSPITAEYPDVLFYLRSEGSAQYFAVKAGLMLVGIIMPYGDTERIGELCSTIGRQLI